MMCAMTPVNVPFPFEHVKMTMPSSPYLDASHHPHLNTVVLDVEEIATCPYRYVSRQM